MLRRTILISLLAIPFYSCASSSQDTQEGRNTDECPDDDAKLEAGLCGCGEVDDSTDTDEDGTLNCNDECPNDPSKTEPGVCGCKVDATGVTVGFEDSRLNLDTGSVEIIQGPFGNPTDSGWDLKIAYNGNGNVHSIVFQNQGNSLKVVHLQTVFDNTTICDATSATFTTNLIDSPFTSATTILIATDQNMVFKLGNPAENSTGVTFDYAALGTLP